MCRMIIFFVRGLKKWCGLLSQTYKYHHSKHISITTVPSYTGKCHVVDIVTHNNIDSKKTSDRFSSIALYYCNNDFLIRTFDFIACSDAVQVTCSKKTQNCGQLREFPIVSHTFAQVRHMIKIFFEWPVKTRQDDSMIFSTRK